MSCLGCEVDGCDANPDEGDIIQRVSAKGEPFRGRCLAHVVQAPAHYLPREAAAIFKVDVRTLARWACIGRIPFVLTLGGHRRYPTDAVHDLVSNGWHATDDDKATDHYAR